MSNTTVMTNTEKRIKELYDKMHRTGLTRDERVELTALEARVEVAKLQEIEVDKAKAEIQAIFAETRRLRAEADQIFSESAREAGFFEILRTEYAGKLLADNEANRNQVFTLYENDVYNDDSLCAAWFASRLKDDPKLVDRFAWTTRPDPNQKKLIDQSRRNTFHDVMVELGLSESEANWNLFPKDLLDNVYVAKDAIQSGKVKGLMQATPAEIQEREEIRIDKHNLKLLYGTSIPELKKLARSEAEQRRAEFQQQEADRVLDVKKQFQEGRFEPLPSHWKGEVLDANFIKRASPQVIRLLRSRFGSYQLDMRLRGAA